MKINNLEFYLVSDGLTWVDAGGPFGLVPRYLYEKYVVPDSENRVSSALFSLVIRSQGKIILVDTGLGNKLDSKGQEYWKLDRSTGDLIENLERVGIAAPDVDIVINTHLHSDHCGWNTRIENGELIPTFPNATYIFQRMEWADASQPNIRTKATYFKSNFETLIADGRVRMLHGDQEITQDVRCVVTPGHTRGHQSVILSTDGWAGIFLADLAGHSFHFHRTSWVTSYDIDPIQTIKSKQRWQRWAAQENAYVFFQHDATKPIARLIEKDGRYSLEDVEGDQSAIVNSPIEKQNSE